MRKTVAGVIALSLFLVLGVNLVLADGQKPGSKCTYDLGLRGDEVARGSVATAEVKKDKIKIKITGAAADTLYTVWFNFNVRPDNTQSVAPAFATTAGVFEGMVMDVNGFITDGKGNAKFKVKLDYNLLQPGASPVVFVDLDMQGANRIGGHWMRKFSSTTEASLQLTDPETRRPLLERGTARGFVIVRHLDKISHGHTPGVGVVDRVDAFSGAFPAACLPS